MNNNIKLCFKLGLQQDRRGIAALEAAFVLPVFLSLLFLIIETGLYFISQTSLDVGVLSTAEALRTSMVAGSAFAPPTASALKSMITSNGGAVLAASALAVDVRQLSTLSSGTVPISDGSDDWGGSGSVLVVRAKATMLFLPGFTAPTIESTSIIRRPSY